MKIEIDLTEYEEQAMNYLIKNPGMVGRFVSDESSKDYLIRLVEQKIAHAIRMYRNAPK